MLKLRICLPWFCNWNKEREDVMSQLSGLATRITAVASALQQTAANLTGDILNLKAEIEALRAQIADPAILAGIDTAVAQLEATTAAMQTLDLETPPIPPPGTP